MRLFFKKIFLIFIIITIVTVSLDYIYTYLYKVGSIQTKYQLLRSYKNQKVNYVFLGSSRVENGVNPELLKITNKTSVNLGFQSAKLIDTYTILKLLDTYSIQYDTCFIQIDYSFNIKDGNSKILASEMIPFYRENQVIKHYFDKTDQSNNFKIPFYRYMNFDSKTGVRTLFKTILPFKNKKINKFKGFIPLDKEGVDFKNSLPNYIEKSNPYFDSIDNYIIRNKKNVIYYFAPVSSKVANIDFIQKLKLKIPLLYDFSSVIKEDKMFTDGTHLNKYGADNFTKILIDSISKKR